MNRVTKKSRKAPAKKRCASATTTTTTTTPRATRSKRTRTLVVNPIVISSPEVEVNNDDTEETKNCRQKAQNKVDAFFDSINVISSDEDDDGVKPKLPNTNNIPTCSYSNAAADSSVILVEEQSKNLPGTSKTTSNEIIDDCNGVLILADEMMTGSPSAYKPSPIKDMKSLIDFRNETEELLKSASSMIDNFKDTKPKKETVKETVKVSESPKGPSCPICLEGLSTKQAVATVCGHLFCKDCITKTIKEMKKCPTCRTALNHKKYHPIYL